VFDLKPGAISPVVNDGLGYHLFQVVEERPGKKIAYEAARRVIADQLQDRSMAAGSRQLKDSSRKTWGDVRQHEYSLRSSHSSRSPDDPG
jgi:parvulin-like peptidyl-prolyl isomerase